MENEFLKNKTDEEKLQYIESILFELDMIDIQTEEDKILIKKLNELKNSIKNKKGE